MAELVIYGLVLLLGLLTGFVFGRAWKEIKFVPPPRNEETADWWCTGGRPPWEGE